MVSASSFRSTSLTQADDVRTWPNGSRPQLGPVNILVNNAAVNGYGRFEDATPEDIETCFEVNVWAPWELMKAVAPAMRERVGGGS